MSKRFRRYNEDIKMTQIENLEVKIIPKMKNTLHVIKKNYCFCLHYTHYIQYSLNTAIFCRLWYFWPPCVWGFPKEFCSTIRVLQFHSVLTYLPREVRLHRLRVQSYMTLHTNFRCWFTSPTCYMCFWLTVYRLSPLLDPINFLEFFTELGKTFYVLDYKRV